MKTPVDVQAPTGKPLLPALGGHSVLRCDSELAATTGFYLLPQGHRLISEFERQSKTFVWTITISPKLALCVDTQGNRRTMAILKRDVTGITLVDAEPGKSIQLITIDPNTATFVYTTQHPTTVSNRASTFVGGCRILNENRE